MVSGHRPRRRNLGRSGNRLRARKSAIFYPCVINIMCEKRRRRKNRPEGRSVPKAEGGQIAATNPIVRFEPPSLAPQPSRRQRRRNTMTSALRWINSLHQHLGDAQAG